MDAKVNGEPENPMRQLIGFSLISFHTNNKKSIDKIQFREILKCVNRNRKQIFMKNTKNRIFRQGDVIVITADSIPTNLKQTKRVTLALGEVTGHHHTIHDGAIGYASDVDALVDYIEVTVPTANLTHQEHSTISIPTGIYKVIKQVEYTPAELRNVRD